MPTVPIGPANPILGETAQFKADSNAQNVNLSIGAYRDDTGKPVVLDSVQKAEQIIGDKKLDNEYLQLKVIIIYRCFNQIWIW